MGESIVYRNIRYYRFFMNLLLFGKYQKRFDRVVFHIDKLQLNSITELCFGDIKVAEYAKNHYKTWIGYDLNKKFVNHAISKGFDARVCDLLNCEKIATADVVVMAGSLYHFIGRMDKLFALIFRSTNRLIISEPIINVANTSGIVGKLVGYLTNAGKGNEQQRYTRSTFLKDIDKYATVYNYKYSILEEFNRDIIILIEKK